MEIMRDTLHQASLENARGEEFIPRNRIYASMNERSVKKVLLERNVRRQDISDLVNIVLHKALRTFAILVCIRRPELLLEFVYNDQLQSSDLDHQLPYEIEKLQNILSDSVAPKYLWKEFYTEQWRFTAPVFDGSIFKRVLHRKSRLPYLIDQPIDEEQEGAYGRISQVEIEPSHRLFNGSQVMLIRKEYKRPSQSDADCEAELFVMSHLKLLNHPNIVKILGCYTYESNHNILFEFAAGGTLARFLEAPRPAIFEHGHTIMMAATGLASALHSLHEFSIDHLAWNAIGTHHDLKPSNILIEQNKFLLADFGLSTLKDASSSSQTRFKQVNQYYSAPECHERVTDDSRMVSRAADIWSLGCIFSELVAYLLGGVEGVNNFRGSRRLIRDNLIVSRFYASPTEEHPAVREWITATMSSSIRSMSLWCHLISDMLCMDPASRPKAGEVVSRIQFATLVCLFEYIQHYFARLLEKDTSVQALIEHERFVSWCHACGIVQDYQSDTLIPDRSCPWHTNGRPSYEAVLSLFVQISTVLETAHTYYADSPNSISKSIRQLNNLLFTGTANNLQGKASMYLKYQVLAKSDLRMLCDLANGTLQPTYHRDLGRIAVVKQMAKFLDERLGQTDPKLYISASDLGIHQELADSFAYTSSLVSLDDGVEHQILVEWKMYQAPQAESNTAAELLQRLENIAILLRKAYESTDLQILPCKGVFQDVGQYRCGLVYMFPEFASGEKAQAITLQQILSPDLRRKSQPPLEVRYHLAHSLATSLAKFHQLSWLQRSISSQNIVFFHPSGTSSWLDGTRTPYFIGYSNSRPDGGIPFTEGPSEDPILRNYMHPVYRANDRIRFRAEFDCFSLGLVLLEIGLWKSLTGIIEGNKRCRGSPDVVRLKLLELEVPLLRLTMGTKYASAVQACLSDSYLQVSEIKGLEVNRTKELWVQFEKTVLDPLALYLVG